jgi:hypothetical protein
MANKNKLSLKAKTHSFEIESKNIWILISALLAVVLIAVTYINYMIVSNNNETTIKLVDTILSHQIKQ